MRGKVLRTRSLRLFVLSLVTASLFAEGPTAQIRFGQVGLRVTDPEAHKKLWVGLLGAKATRIGNVDAIEVPGAFLILTKGESSGGSDGTSLQPFRCLCGGHRGHTGETHRCQSRKGRGLDDKKPQAVHRKFPR